MVGSCLQCIVPFGLDKTSQNSLFCGPTHAPISASKSNISDVKPNGDAQKRSLKCAMNAGDMREEEAGAGDQKESNIVLINHLSVAAL